MSFFYRQKKDVEKALRLFDRAIQADPKFATPRSARSFALAQMFIQGNADDLDACGTQAMADAEKALTLDDRDGFCHYAFGQACKLAGQVDRAIPAHEKAVELQPNSRMF